MDKLRSAYHYIFSSYKRLSAVLIIGGLLLAIPMTMSVVGNQQDIRQQASTIADSGAKPNLFVNSLILRKGGYVNGAGDCTKGTLVTEGMVLTVGEVIEVCVNYGNNGNATAASYFLDNYLNQATKPAAGTAGYQSYPFGPTAPQGSSILQVGSIIPAANCTNGCKAGVFIDRANTVAESNEEDNFAASVTYKVAETTIASTDPTLTPTPTCSPKPACLLPGANPVCAVVEPAGGWCPAPTCTPRPACMEPGANPVCAVVEPAGGFCPTRSTANAIKISLSLTGIGASGSAGINTAPKRPTRTVEVRLFGSINNQVGEIATGSATYQTQTGLYEGTIPLPGVNPGSYIAKVRMDNTLWKQLPGIQSIVAGQTTQVQPTALITGDFNRDNIISMLDYNIMLSCFKGEGTCKDAFSLTDFKNFIALLGKVVKN